MNKYVDFLNNNTHDIDSVCELGAGIFTNFQFYKCNTKIGIELIKTYIDNRICSSDVVAINGNAMKFEDLLKGVKVDSFACIDFLEHLEKEQAIDLIKRMQNYSKRIFVFIPHGTCKLEGTGWDFGNQDLGLKLIDENSKDSAIDAQTHKSTWYVSDFENLGFKVDHDVGYHGLNRKKAPPEQFGTDGGTVMFCVWNRSE